MDKTGWNWLVLLLLTIVVLGVCVLIFFSLLARWGGFGGGLSA